MFVLNFCKPEHFDTVFTKIINSLKSDGIFCAILFGDKDESSHNAEKTYPSKDKIFELLNNLEILHFSEKNRGETDPHEEISTSAHVFKFIARKTYL